MAENKNENYEPFLYIENKLENISFFIILKRFSSRFVIQVNIQKLISLKSKGYRIINSNYNRDLLDFINLKLINNNKTMNINSKFAKSENLIQVNQN